MKKRYIHIRIDKTTVVFAAAAVILAIAVHYAISASIETTLTYPSPSGVYHTMITTAQTLLARDSGNVGIGTSSPQTTSPNGQTRGNLDVNDVWVRGAGGTGGWASQLAGVPAGFVGHFNLASCPAGWQTFPSASGRFILGLPAGGTLGAVVGQSLTDREQRIGGASESWTRSCGFSTSGPNPPCNLQEYIQSIYEGISLSYYGRNSPPAPPAAAMPAPYVQLTVCVKT